MIVVMFFSSEAMGQSSPKYLAIVSDDNPQTAEFISKLKEYNVDFSILNIEKDPRLINFEKEALNFSQLIIIGKNSFKFYLKHQLKIPSLVVYVKNSTFHHLIECFKHSSLVENYSNYLEDISIIYSDPSPKKQIALIKKYYIYNSFTVMLSPLTYFMEDELKQTAKELEMEIHVLKLPSEYDINKALNTLPKKHALLALPDRYIYNRHSLKNIIISTYRSDRPIFGFSKNMVKGGAVISHYSDVNDIVKQSIEIMKNIDRDRIRIYSDFTKIEVNKAVVRSLDVIALKDNEYES